RDRCPTTMAIRVPLISLVIAATAIPVELRPLAASELDVNFDFFDIAANIAGYIPVGIVTGEVGVCKAVGIATVMSALAEVGQLFMRYRYPSPVDFAANVTGAALGIFISRRWRISSPAIRINRPAGLFAGVFVLVVLGAWTNIVGMPER